MLILFVHMNLVRTISWFLRLLRHHEIICGLVNNCFFKVDWWNISSRMRTWPMNRGIMNGLPRNIVLKQEWQNQIRLVKNGLLAFSSFGGGVCSLSCEGTLPFSRIAFGHDFLSLWFGSTGSLFCDFLVLEFAVALIFHENVNFGPEVFDPFKLPIIFLILAKFRIQIVKEVLLLLHLLLLQFLFYALEFLDIDFMLIHHVVQLTFIHCNRGSIMLICWYAHQKTSAPLRLMSFRLISNFLFSLQLFNHLLAEFIFLVLLMTVYNVSEAFVLIFAWDIIVEELPNGKIALVIRSFFSRTRKLNLLFLVRLKETWSTVFREKFLCQIWLHKMMVEDVLFIIGTNFFSSQIEAELIWKPEVWQVIRFNNLFALQCTGIEPSWRNVVALVFHFFHDLVEASLNGSLVNERKR